MGYGGKEEEGGRMTFEQREDGDSREGGGLLDGVMEVGRVRGREGIILGMRTKGGGGRGQGSKEGVRGRSGRMRVIARSVTCRQEQNSRFVSELEEGERRVELLMNGS